VSEGTAKSEFGFLRAHDGSWFSPHHVVRVRRAVTPDGVWAHVEADMVDGSVVVLSETGDLRQQVTYLDYWEDFWLRVISDARRA